MHIFAGAESVPVIKQALGILASEQLATLNDENEGLDLPPEAIILAATGINARFPSRFIRKAPASYTARMQELTTRRLEIPSSVLEIPNLVLVRPSRRTEDGSYEGSDLPLFRESLLQLAGVRDKKASSKQHGARRRSRPFGLMGIFD